MRKAQLGKTLYISKATDRAIKVGLHPDPIQDPVLKKRHEKGFQAYESLPIKVIDESS